MWFTSCQYYQETEVISVMLVFDIWYKINKTNKEYYWWKFFEKQKNHIFYFYKKSTNCWICKFFLMKILQIFINSLYSSFRLIWGAYLVEKVIIISIISPKVHQNIKNGMRNVWYSIPFDTR